MTSIAPTSTTDLIEAYRLIRAGKRRAARKILKPLLESNPRSERTWLLFSYAVLDTAIQRDCLQRVLEINPNNGEARRRLAELNTQALAEAATTEPKPPELSHLLPAWLVDKTSPMVDEGGSPLEAEPDATEPAAGAPVLAEVAPSTVEVALVAEPEAAEAPDAVAAVVPVAEPEAAEAPDAVAAVVPVAEPEAGPSTIQAAPVSEPEAAEAPDAVAAVVPVAEPEAEAASAVTETAPAVAAVVPVAEPEAGPSTVEVAPADVTEIEVAPVSEPEAADAVAAVVPASESEAGPFTIEAAPADVTEIKVAPVSEPDAAPPAKVARTETPRVEPAPAPTRPAARPAPMPRVEDRPLPRRRSADSPLRPNTLIRGRYRIMGEVAAGASSTIYRAFDETEGADVALKFIADPTPAMERDFRRQAELLLQLRHPHLPRYRDYFVLPGHGLYLVMDFIPGDSTESLLEREGPPPESDVRHWAPRLLDALQYLHSQVPPLVHGDAKPANVRLTPEGRVVLVDYGLGRSTAESTSEPFTPPEDNADARSDIYRLGATLYTLLAGQPPEPGGERASGRRALTPVRQHRPEVSPQLAQAIERALSVRPEARFETAVEFAEALPIPEGLKPPPELEEAAPSRAWLVWLAGGLVALGLVAVFAAFWLLGGLGARQTPTPPGPPTLAPVWATATALQAAALLTPTATPTPPASPTPTATLAPSATATPQATPLGGGAGGRIAFVSERGGRPQIYVMNADGSDQTALTDLAEGACQPAWSPDGKQLVFISPCARKAETYPGAALYRVNADGSGVQQLLTLAGGVFDPDWSRSGLTFTVLHNNRPQVYVAGADGSNPLLLSSPVGFDRQPSWSPDGARILFLNNTRAGRPTLYWMNKDGTFADGRNPRQVTRDLDADSPAWSPDGRLVAFITQNNLLTVPWDGLGFGVVELRADGLNDEPAWSPDSQWLVFESWLEFGERDIFQLPAGGGNPVQLTNDPAPDYQPAWQP